MRCRCALAPSLPLPNTVASRALSLRHANQSRALLAEEGAGEGQGDPARRRFRSSWDAKEAGGGRSADADYLYELGASSNINLNIDTGARQRWA